MFEQIEIFKVAHGLATHSATRQGKIAANIANADTPGYRAQDIKPFAETFRASSGSDGLKATRPGHNLSSTPGRLQIEEVERDAGHSISGNSVSVEAEMVEAAQVRQSHDLALTVYQSALGILRTSIRTGR